MQPPQADAGGGAGCGAPCSGLACLNKIDDPLNPGTQVCVDSKGGVSQLCCNNNAAKPCFTPEGTRYCERHKANKQAS